MFNVTKSYNTDKGFAAIEAAGQQSRLDIKSK